MDTISEPIFKRLLYRCQFVLGPNFVENLETWKKIEITNSIKLTVHPDLTTCQVIENNKSITLLGFILDPDNPKSTDTDIVTGLIQKLSISDPFFEHTERLGGRWILIVNDGREIILFNDASGLRQVFYTNNRYTKDLWCASQPGFISELLEFQESEEAVKFINSDAFRNKKENWWPGESSPYREIKRLLPNHYFNLRTGHSHRYWPNKVINQLDPEKAVDEIAKIIRNLLTSAFNRFDLAISLTAGWDSRVVLAASKEISKKVSYITVKHLTLSDSADIEVSSALLSKLGLKHDIVTESSVMNDDFVRVFKKSCSFAHDVYARDAQAIFDCYNLSKVAVTGSVSEIAKCSIRLPGDEKVTAEKLSLLRGHKGHPFATKYNRKWLEGLSEAYNFNIMDLWLWEIRHGIWLAMTQLEFGMVWQDIFTPYNCRKLLIIMLSVDEEYRKSPTYKLYKELCLNLWPETLSEPINPHKNKRPSLKKRCKFYLKRKVKHMMNFLDPEMKNDG